MYPKVGNSPFVRGQYPVLLWNLVLMMVLMTWCRLVFYLLNIQLFPEISFHHLGTLFLAGLRFDLTAVLYTNVLYILLMILPIVSRYQTYYQKTVKFIFIITNALALAANCIDFIYFPFTLRRATLWVFKEFYNDLGNIQLGFRFLFDYWYVVVLFIILVILLVKYYKSARPSFIRQNSLFYSLNTIYMLLTIFLFIIGVRGGYEKATRPLTLNDANLYVNNPIETGIVLNTPFSMYRTIQRHTLKKQSFFSSDQDLQAIYSPIHTPLPNSAFTKEENIVIIILESFSKEYFGVFNKHLDNGRYKGYTPFLDSLVNESFSYQYSFANGKKSIDALPSISAGIPYVFDPFVLSLYFNNKLDALPRILREKGYGCYFFHGAPNGSMGFDAFAKRTGFQSYYGKTEYNNDADYDGIWGIWDEPFFQYFANTLSEKKQPFMAALFSVSSHHPFQIPKQYTGKFPKGTLPIHQCIGYTDYALRRFFETASKMPWFKNTLFVITADHIGSNDQRSYQSAMGAFSVPIIFHKSNSNLKGMEGNRLIQQIDIMPTILGYLNYQKPYFSFGKDVGLDKGTNNDVKISDHFVFNYLNGYYQLYKGDYMLQSDEKCTPFALFKYKTDTLLQNNLLQSHPKERDELNVLTKAFIQQYNNRMLEDSLYINTNENTLQSIR